MPPGKTAQNKGLIKIFVNDGETVTYKMFPITDLTTIHDIAGMLAKKLNRPDLLESYQARFERGGVVAMLTADEIPLKMMLGWDPDVAKAGGNEGCHFAFYLARRMTSRLPPSSPAPGANIAPLHSGPGSPALVGGLPPPSGAVSPPPAGAGGGEVLSRMVPVAKPPVPVGSMSPPAPTPKTAAAPPPPVAKAAAPPPPVAKAAAAPPPPVAKAAPAPAIPEPAAAPEPPAPAAKPAAPAPVPEKKKAAPPPPPSFSKPTPKAKPAPPPAFSKPGGGAPPPPTSAKPTPVVPANLAPPPPVPASQMVAEPEEVAVPQMATAVAVPQMATAVPVPQVATAVATPAAPAVPAEAPSIEEVTKLLKMDSLTAPEGAARPLSFGLSSAQKAEDELSQMLEDLNKPAEPEPADNEAADELDALLASLNNI